MEPDSGGPAGGHGDIHFERTPPTARITVDRPEEQNRLGRSDIERLGAIVDALAVDGEVHAVVLTGAGEDFFSAGLLNPAIRERLAKDQVLDIVRLSNRVFDALEALPQIVIAAVNGAVQAGGVELALACDIRLAGAHTTLSLPEARWGGFPGAGGPVRLPAVVGHARALMLIATGRTIEADEMARIGLVEEVHPRGTVLDAASAMAGEIGRNGPLATRGAKRIMRLRREPGFAAARALSDALRYALEWSEDVDEGIAAHRDGRAPRFTGR